MLKNSVHKQLKMQAKKRGKISINHIKDKRNVGVRQYNIKHSGIKKSQNMKCASQTLYVTENRVDLLIIKINKSSQIKVLLIPPILMITNNKVEVKFQIWAAVPSQKKIRFTRISRPRLRIEKRTMIKLKTLQLVHNYSY